MKKVMFAMIAIIAGALLCAGAAGLDGTRPDFARPLISLPQFEHVDEHAHDCPTVAHVHNAAGHDVAVHVDHLSPIVIPSGTGHSFHVAAGKHVLHAQHDHDSWTHDVTVGRCDSVRIEFNSHSWTHHHHQKE